MYREIEKIIYKYIEHVPYEGYDIDVGSIVPELVDLFEQELKNR